MNLKEIISAGTLLLFSALVFFYAHRYPLGTLTRIGPGFLPFSLSVALAGLSLTILIKAILVGEKGISAGGTTLERRQILRVLLLLSVVVIYVLGTAKLGFPMATFLFVLVLFKFAESYSWPLSVLGALLISVANYLVFVVWLQCQFPKGWFGV